MTTETTIEIDTADGGLIQIEKDTTGYSMTVFDADDYETTVVLDPAALATLLNYFNKELLA